MGSWPPLMVQLDQEPWSVYFLLKVLVCEDLRRPGHNVPIFLACGCLHVQSGLYWLCSDMLRDGCVLWLTTQPSCPGIQGDG